ncbi:hypothetical protein JR316_0010034 [Psilocybe cubensis]|uniref:Uncharacterized protein n=2 Tax=Psilocybe cubensis TaxID=181762 RepID=A0ACB8GPY9_PSICU|nr:hypothetical protein JR316_0010034 [Psilocybe cubensis]KAH9477805.1 hypothetical protein JR316_0010034 [Psilocybe cubensis]
MAKDLPLLGDKGAPKFDEQKPEELLRFLDQLDDLFEKYGVKTDNEKKRVVCRYISPTTESEWRAFSSFQNGTWKRFRKDLIMSYPEAVNLHRGSIEALDKICRKHSGNNQIESHDSPGLMALVRTFRAEAGKLLQPPALVSNRDLVERFIGCLTSEFAGRVGQKLDFKLDTTNVVKNLSQPPAEEDNADDTDEIELVRWEDRHKFVDVVEAAISIAERAAKWNSNTLMKGTYSTARAYGTSDLVPESKDKIYVKLEEQISQLSDVISNQEHKRALELKMLQESQHKQMLEFQNMMLTFKNSLQLNTVPTAAFPQTAQTAFTPKARISQTTGCHYCREETHIIVECPHVRRHLENKWVIKNAEGYVRLPDGSQVHPMGNKSRKEVVESLHRTPGVIPVGKTSSFWQSHNDSPLDAAHYRLHRQYELSKSLMSLREDFGDDAFEAVMGRQSGLDEEEEPTLGNFP